MSKVSTFQVWLKQGPKRLLFICGLLFPPSSSTNLFCRCSLCQGAGWSEEGAAQSNNVWRMTLVQQRCMGEKRQLRSQQCRTRTKPLQTSWTHNLLQGELDDNLIFNCGVWGWWFFHFWRYFPFPGVSIISQNWVFYKCWYERFEFSIRRWSKVFYERGVVFYKKG